MTTLTHRPDGNIYCCVLPEKPDEDDYASTGDWEYYMDTALPEYKAACKSAIDNALLASDQEEAMLILKGETLPYYLSRLITIPFNHPYHLPDYDMEVKEVPTENEECGHPITEHGRCLCKKKLGVLKLKPKTV